MLQKRFFFFFFPLGLSVLSVAGGLLWTVMVPWYYAGPLDSWILGPVVCNR